MEGIEEDQSLDVQEFPGQIAIFEQHMRFLLDMDSYPLKLPLD